MGFGAVAGENTEWRLGVVVEESVEAASVVASRTGRRFDLNRQKRATGFHDNRVKVAQVAFEIGQYIPVEPLRAERLIRVQSGNGITACQNRVMQSALWRRSSLEIAENGLGGSLLP